MSFRATYTTTIGINIQDSYIPMNQSFGYNPVFGMMTSLTRGISLIALATMMNKGRTNYYAPMVPYNFPGIAQTPQFAPYNPFVQNYSAPQYQYTQTQFQQGPLQQGPLQQGQYTPSSSLFIGDVYMPSARRNLYSNPGFIVPSAAVDKSNNAADKTKYGKKDLAFWKNLGYNEEKGKTLLEKAKRSQYRGKKHECVAVVREAINDTYYNGQLHYQRFGKACNIGDEFLCHDSNFKKVIPDWNATANDFPPGAIIVYYGDNGSGNGYVRGDARGHGELAYGDGSGKGLSNYDLAIKPDKIKEVWIPV